MLKTLPISEAQLSQNDCVVVATRKHCCQSLVEAQERAKVAHGLRASDTRGHRLPCQSWALDLLLPSPAYGEPGPEAEVNVRSDNSAQEQQGASPMASADAARGIRSTRAVGSVMAALALVVDQGSKAVVFANLNRGDEMVVLPIFSILPGWNEGAAFGLGQGAAPLLLIILALAISVWLTKLLIEARSTLAAVGLGAAIGGALANIADRIRFGAVRDFIDVHWGALHWPTFNAADIFVVVGILLFVLADLLRQR